MEEGLFEPIETKPKKFRILKIFGIIFIGLILITFLFFYFQEPGDYKKLEEENQLKGIENQLEEQTGREITVKEITKNSDPSIINPLTSVNPRHSFQNVSGSEVAYVTHNGDIGGIGNLTFNYTTGGYGYFRYLQGIIGWFTHLNSTYVNASTIYEGGTSLEDKYEPKSTSGRTEFKFVDNKFMIKVT